MVITSTNVIHQCQLHCCRPSSTSHSQTQYDPLPFTPSLPPPPYLHLTPSLSPSPSLLLLPFISPLPPHFPTTTATVEDIVTRGGSCLIPVFALGRAQELLLILDEYWQVRTSTTTSTCTCTQTNPYIVLTFMCILKLMTMLMLIAD